MPTARLCCSQLRAQRLVSSGRFGALRRGGCLACLELVCQLGQRALRGRALARSFVPHFLLPAPGRRSRLALLGEVTADLPPGQLLVPACERAPGPGAASTPAPWQGRTLQRAARSSCQTVRARCRGTQSAPCARPLRRWPARLFMPVNQWKHGRVARALFTSAPVPGTAASTQRSLLSGTLPRSSLLPGEPAQPQPRSAGHSAHQIYRPYSRSAAQLSARVWPPCCCWIRTPRAAAWSLRERTQEEQAARADHPRQGFLRA
jgi:hypothetical protein